MIGAATTALAGAAPAACACPSAVPSAGTHSCLYRGEVVHRRADGVLHDFRYRLYYVYLDLDEWAVAFRGRWFWSTRRIAPAWFRRRDYLGPATVPLKQAVLDVVERQLGRRPDGAVRMLSQPRTFGLSFNPVTFYYCFSAGGQLECVLAEITNTPWGERHQYVVGDRDRGAAGELRAAFAKQFHVSPFQPMDQTYDWVFSVPGEELRVAMANRRAGAVVFTAALALRRQPLTGKAMAAALLRHPWITAKVLLGIHWQALRLWRRGATFHVHPKKRQEKTA
jgi:hypothetical protein